MSFASSLAIRKAARFCKFGQIDRARITLTNAIETGQDDPRLALRLALVSHDFADIDQVPATGSVKAALTLFAAIDAHRRGDHARAVSLLGDCQADAGGNGTIRLLRAVAVFLAGDRTALLGMKNDLPHCSLEVQAICLAAVEGDIIKNNPDDSGAKEREEALIGPIGWMIARLDDVAVWLYWALSHCLNLVINISSPRNRQVYRHVIEGDRLHGLSRKTEAEKHFRRALELDEENPEALESLAVYCLENSNYEQAGRHMDKLAQQSTNDGGPNSQLTRLRADLLYARGLYREAEPLYMTAAQDAPLNYFIPYRLGLIRLRDGDVTGAEGHFKRALGLINPKLPVERINRLYELIGERAGQL